MLNGSVLCTVFIPEVKGVLNNFIKKQLFTWSIVSESVYKIKMLNAP